MRALYDELPRYLAQSVVSPELQMGRRLAIRNALLGSFLPMAVTLVGRRDLCPILVGMQFESSNSTVASRISEMAVPMDPAATHRYVYGADMMVYSYVRRALTSELHAWDAGSTVLNVLFAVRHHVDCIERTPLSWAQRLVGAKKPLPAFTGRDVWRELFSLLEGLRGPSPGIARLHKEIGITMGG